MARTAKQEDAYVRHIRACLETIPDAELHVCEWHLRHALERLMGKLRTEQQRPPWSRRSASDRGEREPLPADRRT